MELSLSCPPGYSKLFLKYDASCKYCREILFKPNQARAETRLRPNGKTLIVAGVPPYCNEESLKVIFSKFGNVESVQFASVLTGESQGTSRAVKDVTGDDLKYFPNEKVNGFCYAYVVYEEKESIIKAMNHKIKPSPIILPQKADVGMRKWVNEYANQYPNAEKLQKNIDSYMSRYDQAMKEREEAEKQAGEEDEDGWIKVTRGGKTPVIARTEANQLKAKQKEKMKKKRRDLLNSYSYQIRESKRQKIAELRQKFEEDKQRVQEMVEARRFRPF